MRAGVITFPGSNCDRDLAVAFERALGAKTLRLWHAEPELPRGLDLIGLPGGFSYGDYLRCGAIAARAPIVAAVREAVERGVLVIGICNGFQVLTEARILEGALVRNAGLDFVCRPATLEVTTRQSAFTSACPERITLPVAHHDGAYSADDATIARLEDEDRIAFRYAEPVNGSKGRIAGILGGPHRNALGLMPHPERAVDPELGFTDGAHLLRSIRERIG